MDVESSAPTIGVLGKIDTLSEFEELNLQACEAVLIMPSRFTWVLTICQQLEIGHLLVRC